MNASDYIDLTTDFGFKRFLSNETLLIQFINAVLCLPDPVKSIEAIAQIVGEFILTQFPLISW